MYYILQIIQYNTINRWVMVNPKCTTRTHDKRMVIQLNSNGSGYKNPYMVLALE